MTSLEPMVFRLSPPEGGDEDNWDICGHHNGYPMYERKRMPATQDWIRNKFMEEAKQRQVGGEHYKLAIQPIDFIVANNIPFREANVIKYVVRHREKNGKQDIEKAIHYLQMLLEDYDV